MEKLKLFEIEEEYIKYLQKINNMSMGYIKNTVDFKLLEEKSRIYKST